MVLNRENSMSPQDKLQRFIFEHAAVRGEIADVSQTFQQMLANHTYPLPVQLLLGEMLVVTSLMAATLKFEGDITVQLQGDGPLTLAVINGNHRQQMRGIARVKTEIPDGSSLKQMIGNGALVITISPTQGERYQGIVALEGETLSESIEAYFHRSEQLPTRLFIRQDEQNAAGILLQVLPSESPNAEQFDHLATLADTINLDELISLSANDVLWRLYHEEEVTVFEPQQITFSCGCSRARCGEVLQSIAADEIEQILAEEGKIEMNCEYCGNTYQYDAIDIAELRKGFQSHSPTSQH